MLHTHFTRRRPPTPTAVFDTYWRFAAERQEIFFRRLEGTEPPWTTDPVLRAHRFTNVYRASDRVSQYLIRKVIYQGDFSSEDVLLRILLFKIFNSVRTWETVQASLGEITARTFSARKISQILERTVNGGTSIYSGAYIMPSGVTSFGHARKHDNHLALIQSVLKAGFSTKLSEIGSLKELYAELLALPTFGPFLAMQLAIDINYSDLTDFDEMEFIVAGPGAIDGLSKCFSSLGDYSTADAIRWVAEQQEDAFRSRGLAFRTLWGRPLQLIDCQNVFCEISKYARVVHPEVSGSSGRTRIKQKYKTNPDPLEIWFPPKWHLDSPKFQTTKKTGQVELALNLH